MGSTSLLALQIEQTIPLSQVLVTLGAIDQETLESELREFHRIATENCIPDGEANFPGVDAIEMAFAEYELLS
ncbi:hypothetical protein GC197_13650 [bacterium]|nr:hypothetical protein [bacterium]